jgi:hypothetical protein
VSRRKVGCRRRKIGGILLVLSLGMVATSPAGSAETSPRLDGTFIQLSAAHGTWTETQWEDLFRDLRRLRLTRIVVQWSMAGDTAFYESAVYATVPKPPLETILRLAEESGMGVLVGLAHDPAFWERIDGEPPLVEAYLARLRGRSLSVARELAPRLGGSAAFAGWYLSEEVDDFNWLEPRRRRSMAAHLKEQADALHALTPGRSVAVSGYSGANCDPIALAALWRDLLEVSSLDLLLFQDGVGALNLDVEHVPEYLEALKGALRDVDTRLAVIVEVFRQTGGPPLDEGEFRAEPASLDRVRRQLMAAGSDVEGRYAFSVPDYMRPSLGPRAAELFGGYLRLVEQAP